MRCPQCSHIGLKESGDEVQCASCSQPIARMKKHKGLDLLEQASRDSLEKDLDDWRENQDLPKVKFKYINALKSPTLNNYSLEKKQLRELVSTLPADARILEVGGALTREVHERALSVDLLDASTTDIRGDILSLPFEDNVADLVVANRILEHVKEPVEACKELARVVKPGGKVYTIVPFMTPYHRLPLDQFRFSLDSLPRLFPDFETVKLEPFEGPVRAMLWMKKEFFAQAIPGTGLWRTAYLALREAFGWLSYPAVLLDPWLKRHKEAHKISLTLLYVGQKR